MPTAHRSPFAAIMPTSLSQQIATGIADFEQKFGNNPYGIHFTKPFPKTFDEYNEDRGYFEKLIKRKFLQEAEEKNIWSLSFTKPTKQFTKSRSQQKRDTPQLNFIDEVENDEKDEKYPSERDSDGDGKKSSAINDDIPDAPTVIDDDFDENKNFFTFKIEPHPLNHSTLPATAAFIQDLIRDNKNMFDKKYGKSKSKYLLKTVISFLSKGDDEDTRFPGATFKNNVEKGEKPFVPSLTDIKQPLKVLIGQHHSDSDYQCYLARVEVKAIPYLMGCDTDTYCQTVHVKNNKCKLISWKACKFNCTFLLLNKHFKLPDDDSACLKGGSGEGCINENNIRKDLKYKINTMVAPEQLETIYLYYQKHFPNKDIKGFVLFDHEFKLITCYSKLDKSLNSNITSVQKGVIIMVALNNHCYEFRVGDNKPSSISKDISHRTLRSTIPSLERVDIGNDNNNADEERDDSEDEKEETKEEIKEDSKKQEVKTVVSFATSRKYRAVSLADRRSGASSTGSSKVEKFHSSPKSDADNTPDPGFKQCPDCGKKYMRAHKCNSDTVSYYQNRILGNNVNVAVSKKPTKVTSADGTKSHDNTFIYVIAQSAKLPDSAQKTVIEFSIFDTTNGLKLVVNNLQHAVDYLLKRSDVTLITYEGTAFDFILGELVRRKIQYSDYLPQKGEKRVMKFKFGNNINARNLSFWLQGFQSFDEVCGDLQIPSSDSFIITKLQTVHLWVRDFLLKETDVLMDGLLTVNQLIYKYWEQSQRSNVPYFPPLDEWKFQARSSFSAMTYPLINRYQSKWYDELVQQKQSGNSHSGMYHKIKESGDYRMSYDDSSCYPAGMAGTDFCPVEYGCGLPRWSNKPTTEFKNKKWGFYEIEYVPPTNLRIPILPRKTEDGDVFDLLPGKGVYTSVEIQNALEFGKYKIKFFGRCSVWDRTDREQDVKVFAKLIHHFYKLKSQFSKGSVQYVMCKIIINGLYGNMGKAPNVKVDTQTISSLQDEAKFESTHTAVDVQLLDSHDESENEKSEYKPRVMNGRSDTAREKADRPFQNACFILSYARRIMFSHLSVIDPSFTSTTFSNITNDAIRVSSAQSQKLLDAGRIKNELGYLVNDLPNNGIIAREINLDVNRSLVEWINDKDEVFLQEKGQIKLSGCRAGKQDYRMFDSDKVVKVSWTTEERILDETKKDNAYQVLEKGKTWTYKPSLFKRFNLVDNEWVPPGYEIAL